MMMMMTMMMSSLRLFSQTFDFDDVGCAESGLLAFDVHAYKHMMNASDVSGVRTRVNLT